MGLWESSAISGTVHAAANRHKKYMNHLIASFLLFLFIGCSLFTTEDSQTDNAKLRERATKLHREAIVIDTHNDVTSPMTDEGFDLGARDTSGKVQTDIPRMKEGGLDAEFFAIY